MSTQYQRATLLGLSSIFLWSTTIAVARSVTEFLGPIAPAIAIYTIGGLLLLLVKYQQTKTPPLKTLRCFSTAYILICGSLFIINMTTFYIALGMASDRQALLCVGLINYTWPTLTILFSIPILKRKASYLLGLGLLLATVGVSFVITHNTELNLNAIMGNIEQNVIAYTSAFVSALTWGLYSNLTSSMSTENEESAVPFFMLGTVVLLLFLNPFFPHPITLSWITVLEIVFLAVSNSLGYLFWDWAMRKGDSVLVATVSYLIPFFSSLAICLYFGISAGDKLWIGCALIIAGAFISKHSLKAKNRQLREEK